MIPAIAHEEEEERPAPGSSWENETCTADDRCGHFGPYHVMTYNAVGASMVWTRANWEQPKIQYKGRHSEFKATDVYDMQCVEAAIRGSGFSRWPIPRTEWQALFPTAAVVAGNVFLDADTVTRFDTTGNSHLRKSLNPCIRSSFKHLVYGGYTMHQGQSLFVASRIRAHWDKEGAQVWDLGHPDAFKTRPGGVFDNALLDEEDALLNLASFTDAGASRGLHYSIYSLGYATLADGRVVNVGGHSMQSNNGFRKLNIYDPETNSWAPRPVPCNIANWRADPGGVRLGYKSVADAVAAAGGQPGSFAGHAGYIPSGDQLVNPPNSAPSWTNCDPRNRDHMDPPHQSDMRYPRWYPSAITLPNNKVLVYGGDDLDETVGPNTSIGNVTDRDNAFRATRVMIPVAELYDPQTDRTIALENARKMFSLYPAATVVETGPGDNDWKLCTLSGESAPASEASMPRSNAIDEAAEWRRFCSTPGCAADQRAIRFLGLRPSARLDCLDVQAAERDAQRNVPAENHWTHIATAKNEYGYCCGMADIVKIGPGGRTLSHRWIAVNGAIGRGLPGQGTRTAEVEMIEFTDPSPQWRVVAQTYQPGSNIHVVPLPDGNVLFRGGSGPGGGTYELRNYTRAQLFNPDDLTLRVLAKSTQLGGLHKTLMLLPDATVISMAGDRTAMVAVGDRVYSPGDQDLGISTAQIFTPPYLFGDAAGTRKPRPVIERGPDHVTYRQAITLKVSDAANIKTVSMVRTGSVTHQLANDNRLVILNFKRGPQAGTLVVDAPHRPAQAIPGTTCSSSSTPTARRAGRSTFGCSVTEALCRNRPVPRRAAWPVRSP
ncbi:kelch motif-containing protein [Ramlibacter montanisoli]|uniref:DUF1929 domain-containing protein n=1 Tax=Ramlibacter montanisoli TaxID=2732512 RepID=A0A849KIS4_9BURK|nr:kelch motif-containing protein [Ramlibacter montanisoli]NNU43953.1 DUF1929 domain-containing protein [Ramlibacter montanisoli]